ncbi:hypothetical protein [Paraburkholderia fungorum]|uniref:hypothetical protein n=1 Tax=Paraburkholderia fungorum TaxID=134537 RepID=UPI0038B6D0D3
MVDEFNAPFSPGDNLQQRCACVLVLDHSGSMEGEPIEKLNAALRDLHRAGSRHRAVDW